MRVIESSQDFEFSLDLLEYSKLSDLLFVQDLYGDFVTGLLVKGHPYFAECSIPQIL